MKLDKLPEALTFDDVLIVPQYSSLLSRSTAITSWNLDKFQFSVPVIAANMDTICDFKMMKKMANLGGLGIHHRYCSVEDYQGLEIGWQLALQLNDVPQNSPLAVSVGSIYNDKSRINWAIDTKSAVDIICIDIAHGHSVHIADTLKYIRDKGFTGPIIAGNVCTSEGTHYLLKHGATIVKVGVGPGSVCTTRTKTGCGFPQLSAIANCSEAGPIIADGGIRTPGDAAKALAAGAKAVMIGGMLAGTDCVPGWDDAMAPYNERLEYARKGFSGSTYPEMPHIKYRGMASKEARQSFSQEGTNAEGVSRLIECKPLNSTEAVIIDIVEGIKSAMSYSGAYTLGEFSAKAKFIRTTNATQTENHPHFKS